MIQLAEHPIVGWDFDGTLIGHPLSRRFLQFINDNPYGQEHHIISFRSHGLECNFERDLIAEHGTLADVSRFAQMHNLPDEMYEASLAGAEFGWGDDPALEWKGAICNLVGATVLVDDMGAQVVKGCEKFGVRHIHPDELSVAQF